ncbi:MAG: hypothetical protein QM811_02260 [Pirellulales bacterium]
MGDRVRRRRWPWVVLGILVALGLGAGWLVFRLSRVRPFYATARAIPQERLETGSRDFLNRTSRLSSKLQRPPPRTESWSLTLTDDQINGWLAVDLTNNHEGALPPEIHDPRVRIAADRISFGVMIETPALPIAASLDLVPKLISKQEFSIRILTARLGELPWSLESVVAPLTTAIREQGWNVRQTAVDGDPVLIFTLPTSANPRADLRTRPHRPGRRRTDPGWHDHPGLRREIGRG